MDFGLACKYDPNDPPNQRCGSMSTVIYERRRTSNTTWDIGIFMKDQTTGLYTTYSNGYISNYTMLIETKNGITDNDNNTVPASLLYINKIAPAIKQVKKLAQATIRPRVFI